jgi:hypothetical protein
VSRPDRGDHKEDVKDYFAFVVGGKRNLLQEVQTTRLSLLLVQRRVLVSVLGFFLALSFGLRCHLNAVNKSVFSKLFDFWLLLELVACTASRRLNFRSILLACWHRLF